MGYFILSLTTETDRGITGNHLRTTVRCTALRTIKRCPALRWSFLCVAARGTLRDDVVDVLEDDFVANANGQHDVHPIAVAIDFLLMLTVVIGDGAPG